MVPGQRELGLVITLAILAHRKKAVDNDMPNGWRSFTVVPPVRLGRLRTPAVADRIRLPTGEGRYPGALRFHDRLQQTAERGRQRVAGEGLAGPDRAKLIRAGQDGAAVTDGVFVETKEFLAGYWIVDVQSAERAYAIVAQASAAPGPGGTRLNMPIEVREVLSGPPPDLL